MEYKLAILQYEWEYQTNRNRGSQSGIQTDGVSVSVYTDSLHMWHRQLEFWSRANVTPAFIMYYQYQGEMGTVLDI